MRGDMPVVVYGASGYTGRLTMEYMRDFGLPFIAAGRDAKRIEAAVAKVPGLETAKYKIVEVEHTAEALAKAFRGAVVVCNTVGPFYRYGLPVAEAALQAGAHYLDSTGEQPWMIQVQQALGPAFAKAGLLLAPASAYMYTVGHIAAELALERVPGADTVDILTYLNGTPTYASTQSIFDLLRAPAHYLEDGEYVEWPAGQAFETSLPVTHMSILAAPWGGGGAPVWYRAGDRVRNARMLVGWPNRGLVQGVVEMGRAAAAELKGKSESEKIAVLSAKADAIQSGMPPRENHFINRSCDSAIVRSSTDMTQIMLLGTCAYKQTGVILAFAAHACVRGVVKRVGFSSACEAFGHRNILAALKNFGLAAEKVLV